MGEGHKGKRRSGGPVMLGVYGYGTMIVGARRMNEMDTGHGGNGSLVRSGEDI